jgi:hypothetical protein
MSDLSKPPICPGECIRCGRIAQYWFCLQCLAVPVHVDRTPRPRIVQLPQRRHRRLVREAA